MRTRRAAAYQAWWEHQPVRVPRAKTWADLSITRTIDWGGLARFWVLDTRQYRSNQACGDGNKVVPCGNWADPSRTLMGAAQERWLFDGLAASTARWQVLANQVRIAPFDNPGPQRGQHGSMERLSGSARAAVECDRDAAPNRTVVITGDIHSNWVNDLRARNDRPMRRSSGSSSSARASPPAATAPRRARWTGQDARGKSALQMAQRAARLCRVPLQRRRVSRRLPNGAVRHQARCASPDGIVLARAPWPAGRAASVD